MVVRVLTDLLGPLVGVLDLPLWPLAPVLPDQMRPAPTHQTSPRLVLIIQLQFAAAAPHSLHLLLNTFCAFKCPEDESITKNQ